MTIQIIKQPPLRMTQTDLDRYRAEYQQTYMCYSGTPPAFEDWVREKVTEKDCKK